jgi:PAS domain S-box-containing protein
VLEELGTQLGWQFGAFWLVDDVRHRLRCAAVWSSRSYPQFESASRANNFWRGRGVPGQVWETGSPVWLSDISGDARLPRQQIAHREGLHCVFAFPVVGVASTVSAAGASDQDIPSITTVTGVIELYREQIEPPDEQMLNAATSMGFQLGVFLESRRAHDAERAQRLRNAAVTDVSLDCIITIDDHGRILEWNPAAERTFGHTRAAVLRRQLAETIIPPQLREAHYRGLAQYLQTGEGKLLGKRVEVEGMRADGSVFPCELAVTRVPVPGPPVFTAYLRDLSGRRRLEATQQLLLRASNVLLSYLDSERMLCNLSKVVVPAFADWYAVDVVESDRSVRRLETKHRDPAKLDVAQLLADRYANRPESEYGARAVIRTGRSELVSDVSEKMLAEIAQDDEHLRLIRTLGLRSFIIVPLRGRDAILGAMTFVSAESGRRFDSHELEVAEELATRAAQAIDNARLFTDVEESRRLLEEQATELEAQAAELETTAEELEHSNVGLRRAVDDLAQRTAEAEQARLEAEAARREADEANRAKSEFLAAMSHELRTPLNAIIGYAQLLDVGIRGPVSPEQRSDLGRIERSSQHLLGLITDILNYAKIESGRIEYEIKATPLDQSLAAVEELIAPLARAKEISYRFRTECPGILVCADAEKLRQILVNLLSNAIRYTAERGCVDVQCSASNDAVLIDVIDTGVGIPSDKLEAIFEPFVQVDRTYNGQRQGTGLGLAISRDLARGMRGDLTVQSELGKGSVFSVHLKRGKDGAEEKRT